MRMWMVNPRKMCIRHLCAEHGEIHKHRHNFVKGHSMQGRIQADQIEPMSMKARHDALAREIDRRAALNGTGGHRSPYRQPSLAKYPEYVRVHRIDRVAARAELYNRCKECKV